MSLIETKTSGFVNSFGQFIKRTELWGVYSAGQLVLYYCSLDTLAQLMAFYVHR